MKTLGIFNSGMQATMTVDYLKSHGIEAFSRGSREYASIVTGGDMGRYEVLVPEEQLEEAEKLLKKLTVQSVPEEDPKDPPIVKTSQIPSVELKKAIIFCAAGWVVFPAFWLLSLYFTWRYWKLSSGARKNFGSLALIFLHVGVFSIYAWLGFPSQSFFKDLFF